MIGLLTCYFRSASKKRMEAIFYHMFSSMTLKNIWNSSPLVAIIQNWFEDNEIFIHFPTPTPNCYIHVIKPMLPALFGCLEVLSVRLLKKKAWNICPSSIHFSPESSIIYIIQLERSYSSVAFQCTLSTFFSIARA